MPESDLPRAAAFAFGLTPSEVGRFRDIMRREYDEALTEEEAWGRAIEVLALFRSLAGPLPVAPSPGSSNIHALDQRPSLSQG